MFLTLFLLFAGLFSAAGGILKWKWFFENPNAQFVMMFLGRNGARVFYIALGAVLITVGGSRLASPPLTVTEPMLQTLTQPWTFSLLSEKAAPRLEGVRELRDLAVSKDGQWQSFSTVWTSAHSLFPVLRDTDTFSVDIEPAFTLRRTVAGQAIKAAQFYFDQDLHSCDNWLMSKHPLESAAFMVVVFDEASTRAVTGEPGLLVTWLHRSSPLYRKYTSY
ncbi:MAG: immunity 17 family protein [Verrucomicrobiota bacterium]